MPSEHATRGTMLLLRALLLRRPALALLLVLAALAVKLVVPSGYMIGTESRVLTVRICADATDSQIARHVAIPMRDGGSAAGHQQTKGECPYASLSMASTGAADPVLLALALVFILALGFAPVRIPRARRLTRLRPPLRGPPSLA